MRNSIIKSLKTNEDFIRFINDKFDKPSSKFTFPENYERRRTPKSILEKEGSPSMHNNIQRRERIRDYIFIEYKFDIYEYPFIVYHQDEKEKDILKPYKKIYDAQEKCMDLRNQGISSLLIMIMNYEIECKIYEI